MDPEVTCWQHTLPDNEMMEVISSVATVESKPPLVFIHGAGHGAWCWKEHFMQYFTSRGYSCFALTLRNHAANHVAGQPGRKGVLELHAQDVGHFIAHNLQQPPFLIGHSFGGLLAQAYLLLDYRSRPKLSGVGLLASASPEGLKPMSDRFWKFSKLKLIRLIWTFTTMNYFRSSSQLRYLWFSDDLPAADLKRYAALYWDNLSHAFGFDPAIFDGEVPLPRLPSNASPIPVFVLGGEDDTTVDVKAFYETADYYSTQPVIIPHLAHDVMLDTKWENAAEALLKRFESI